jgi:mRNA-degrading endonuclease toxin of MazEF toxin-antitoxin module
VPLNALTRGAVIRVRDAAGALPSPFLVVSSDAYHARGYSMIIALMSAIPGSQGRVTAVTIGDHGIVLPDELRTIGVGAVDTILGQATDAEMDLVDAVLRVVLHL